MDISPHAYKITHRMRRSLPIRPPCIMSDSASLPSYTSALPAYEAAGYARPALADRTNPRTAAGSFSKESKNGALSLHLTAQDAHALVPTYGLGGTVEGSVRVSKPEGVHAVELKVRTLLWSGPDAMLTKPVSA
jgi:hypothetical protein